MFWLLLFAAVLIALLTAVIVLPVRFRLRGQAGDKTWIRLDIQTFGGVAPAIAIFDSAKGRKEKPGKERQKKEKAAGSSRSGRSFSNLPVRSLFGLIVDLLRQFRIVWIRGEAEFGLDDPADTGTVYGILAPLIYGGGHAADIDLEIRPDFEKSCLSGKIDTAVDVMPFRLLPPVLRFGWQTFGPGSWTQE